MRTYLSPGRGPKVGVRDFQRVAWFREGPQTWVDVPRGNHRLLGRVATDYSGVVASEKPQLGGPHSGAPQSAACCTRVYVSVRPNSGMPR